MAPSAQKVVLLLTIVIGGAIVAKTWSPSESRSWFSLSKGDDADDDKEDFVIRRRDEQMVWKDHGDWNNYPEFQLPFNISQCTHVYLDLGTNRGFQLEKLFLGSKPHSPWAQKFGQYFGPRSEWVSKVCAIGAEPDRTHTGHLNDLEKRITATGARLKILRNPIWVNNDVMTFHSVWQPEFNNWGSTLSTTGHAHMKNVTKYTLRGFRLSSLLAQLRRDAVVVAKLDIEGAEHRVIADIVLDGTICRIDFVGIEIHRTFMTHDIHALSSNTATLNRFLRASGRCRYTRIEEFDDES